MCKTVAYTNMKHVVVSKIKIHTCLDLQGISFVCLFLTGSVLLQGTEEGILVRYYQASPMTMKFSIRNAKSCSKSLWRHLSGAESEDIESHPCTHQGVASAPGRRYPQPPFRFHLFQ